MIPAPLSPTHQRGVKTRLSRLLRRRLLLRLIIFVLIAITASYYIVYDLPTWPGTFTIVAVQSSSSAYDYDTTNTEMVTTDLSNGNIPEFSLPSALPHIPSKIWQIYRKSTEAS